jgi:hypothetical protein
MPVAMPLASLTRQENVQKEEFECQLDDRLP